MTTLCETGLLLEADFACVPCPAPEPQVAIAVMVRCGELTAEQEEELRVAARLQRLEVARERLLAWIS